MKKTVQQNKEIYDYMVSANKKIILSGKNIDPTCYAVVLNEKKEFSIFPIPLNQAGIPEERIALLSAMAKILKKNKVKVNMFLTITTATVHKKNETEKKECLIFSAKDSLDNSRYSMYNIIKKDGKIELNELEDKSSIGWNNKDKIEKEGDKFEDSMLTSFWNEYRKCKKA